MVESFGWSDYLVCCLLFVCSLGIGVYFGLLSRRKKGKWSGNNETKDVLLGGRKMNAFPISCSMLATLFSPVSLLGYPYEIYHYGVMYTFTPIPFSIGLIITSLLFVPIFHNLQIFSSYQYLALRFSKVNQVMVALVFLIQQVAYTAMVIYIPALAFQIIVNINQWIVVSSIVISCTIYTTLGGLKAVIWTDVFQLIVIFAGIISILIIGTLKTEGLTKVMTTALKHNRLQLDTSFDPRTRHSVVSIIVGMSFVWCGIYGTSQPMIQRAISVKSVRQAKLAYLLNIPGIVLVLSLISLCGYVIFSNLYGCDPFISGHIKKPDEIVPYFVSKYMSEYPVVRGIFVSGILSAALSTMSSSTNSMAAVTLSDIIMLKYNNLSDSTSSKISKILVVIYGIIILLFALLISLTSKIMEVSTALFGMVSGPILGVFSLGMFFPVANYKGAIAGHIFSQIFLFWLGFSSYAHGIKHPRLSLSNFNCTGNGNVTRPIEYFITANGTQIEGIQNFFAISYLWYGLIGWALVLLVGLPISLITGSNGNEKVPSQLISPPFRKMWRKYLVYSETIRTYDIDNSKDQDSDVKLQNFAEKDEEVYSNHK